jgi:hypothetical protein
MSERALALFLRGLLERDGAAAATGAIAAPTTLARLGEQPAPALQTLMDAHLNAMLAGWPGGATLRPTHIPSAVLWVGAALNNLARATTHPSPRLLTITLRMVEGLPVASTREAALAYHSLLRHLERITPPPGSEGWQRVVSLLLRCSPLTAAWLPRPDAIGSWELLLAMLREPAIAAMLRDRWLNLLPPPETLLEQSIATSQARANVELGRLLEGVVEQDRDVGRQTLLVFYEADCLLQRRGSDNRPTWPLLRWLHMTRGSSESLVRRNGERVLVRYRPLAPLLARETLLQPYTQLDIRFLEPLGALLVTSKHMRMWRVTGDG